MRFPFDHLNMAETQERDQLQARALRIGLTTSERTRLNELRLRSFPKIILTGGRRGRMPGKTKAGKPDASPALRTASVAAEPVPYDGF